MENFIELTNESVFICSAQINAGPFLKDFGEHLNGVCPVLSGKRIIGYASFVLSNKYFDFLIYIEKSSPERLDIETNKAFLVPILIQKNTRKICAFKISLQDNQYSWGPITTVGL